MGGPEARPEVPGTMSKRVYLHIGWEKTGSSSIQAFCARNQKWLHKHGVDYPLMGPIPQHVELYRNLNKNRSSRIQKSVDAIRAEIAKSDLPNIVFSHESLHSCSPAVFRHIFDGHDVKVIAYVRRPDRAVISFFVTMVRFGQLSAGNFFKSLRFFSRTNLGHFEYYWSLAGFAAEFGKENMMVRHYDRSTLVGGQTVSDFLDCLGLDDAGSKWSEARSNPSLDADQFAFALYFARTIRELPPFRVRKITHSLCYALMAGSTPDRDRPVERFVPASLRRRLLGSYEPSFPLLYREYFGGEEIFADPAGAAESQEYGEIPADRLAEFVTIARKAKDIPGGVYRRFELAHESGGASLAGAPSVETKAEAAGAVT